MKPSRGDFSFFFKQYQEVKLIYKTGDFGPSNRAAKARPLYRSSKSFWLVPVYGSKLKYPNVAQPCTGLLTCYVFLTSKLGKLARASLYGKSKDPANFIL